MEEGAFENLPGRGQPLPLDVSDEAFGGEWRLAYRMLKSAGMAPRWIELDQQIRCETAAVRDDLRRACDRWPEGGPAWQRAVDRNLERIERVNGWIMARNYLAPESVRPRFPLQLDRELDRLQMD